MDASRFIVLAISLANPPGEPESEFHQIVTIYPAKWRDFYRIDQDGRQICRDRWLKARK
jgi:hypothetical protein